MQVISLFELILISAGSILVYALFKTIFQTLKNK